MQRTKALKEFFNLYIFRLLPESIPWLAANGKIDQAERILKRAARFSSVTFPEKILRREHCVRDEKDAEMDQLKPEMDGLRIEEVQNEAQEDTDRSRASTESSGDVNTNLVVRSMDTKPPGTCTYSVGHIRLLWFCHACMPCTYYLIYSKIMDCEFVN